MALVSLAIVSHNRPEEEVMYMRDFSSDNTLGRMSSLDDFEYDLFNLPPQKTFVRRWRIVIGTKESPVGRVFPSAPVFAAGGAREA